MVSSPLELDEEAMQRAARARVAHVHETDVRVGEPALGVEMS